MHPTVFSPCRVAGGMLVPLQGTPGPGGSLVSLALLLGPAFIAIVVVVYFVVVRTGEQPAVEVNAVPEDLEVEEGDGSSEEDVPTPGPPGLDPDDVGDGGVGDGDVGDGDVGDGNVGDGDVDDGGVDGEGGGGDVGGGGVGEGDVGDGEGRSADERGRANGDAE